MSGLATEIVTIAEIGANHCGSLDLAIRMVDAAAESGASAVKFQKRDVDARSDDARLDAPYTTLDSFGATYRAHRRALEFDSAQLSMLRSRAHDAGLGFAVSVWDLPSARLMAALNPDYLKIPSPVCTDEELLETVLDSWEGDLHISLGMTTGRERDRVRDVLEPALRRTTVYACTSAYPPPVGQLAIGEVAVLKDRWYGAQAVGYSGHHLEHEPDAAALALGATVFERHFTLDRQLKGSDQRISLLPREFARLTATLRDLHSSLSARPIGVLPCEAPAAARLKVRARV